MIAIPRRCPGADCDQAGGLSQGMDGLAAVVKEHLRADPYSGAIFVFRAKRADRVKLMWDGTGLRRSPSGSRRGASAGRRSRTVSCG